MTEFMKKETHLDIHITAKWISYDEHYTGSLRKRAYFCSPETFTVETSVYSVISGWNTRTGKVRWLQNEMFRCEYIQNWF